MNERSIDKFGENVLQQREQRRRRPYFPFSGEILFSDAIKAVARTPAPMVYSLIVTRQPYPPDAKQIARLKKARLWPPKSVEFSFPLREARFHGLTEKGLAKGLRELHRVGIIDIVRHGSAIRGDYSIFILSERWRSWGKPDLFDARPWPKARFVPERDKVTKQFIRQSRKESARKLLEANIATIDPPVVVENATTDPLLVANIAMNTPLESPLLVAKSAVIIDLLQGSEVEPKVQDSEGRSKRKVRTLGHGSKVIAAPSKTWRPPLSEIKENVAEILRQRPDPRADDQRFVRFLADQLFDAQRGKLNPARVHRDLQERHDLDDWTTDLLFTIATLDLIQTGAMN